MLQDKRLAVLGAGKMGGALGRGLVSAGAMAADHIVVFDTDGEKARNLAHELGTGCRAADNACSAVERADIILVAVKPKIVANVLKEIASAVGQSQLIISIAAGVHLAKMEALLPPDIPVVRAMPNTPCLVGAGASAVCAGAYATASHMQIALSLFAAVGISVEVEERLMDAVTGLSGSGPAYVYMMIEALADGGVKAGLTRDTARRLAGQTVFGAALMVLRSEDHPAQLKDNVTTPGGTTIAALAVLERAGFRIALMDAIEAAAERSREMS
jgi:pyrroline-5-carboxylate reductase